MYYFYFKTRKEKKTLVLARKLKALQSIRGKQKQPNFKWVVYSPTGGVRGVPDKCNLRTVDKQST